VASLRGSRKNLTAYPKSDDGFVPSPVAGSVHLSRDPSASCYVPCCPRMSALTLAVIIATQQTWEENREAAFYLIDRLFQGQAGSLNTFSSPPLTP
jgi:hypothetical protein